MEDSSCPPFLTTYRNLFEGCCEAEAAAAAAEEHHYCNLPFIDLGRLHGDELEAERCKRDIAAAAADWGFFQIVNHGVPAKLMARLREEQAKMFRQPFKKKSGGRLLDFADDSYRWGTPSATCLRQLSWSEAYHIPLSSSSSNKSTPRSSNCKYNQAIFVSTFPFKKTLFYWFLSFTAQRHNREVLFSDVGASEPAARRACRRNRPRQRTHQRQLHA